MLCLYNTQFNPAQYKNNGHDFEINLLVHLLNQYLYVIVISTYVAIHYAKKEIEYAFLLLLQKTQNRRKVILNLKYIVFFPLIFRIAKMLFCTAQRKMEVFFMPPYMAEILPIRRKTLSHQSYEVGQFLYVVPTEMLILCYKLSIRSILAFLRP